MSKSLDQLHQYLAYGGFGPVEREVRWHPTRKFRADFFMAQQGDAGVIVEYEGLMRHGANQGHASINGILRDIEKSNEALALGIPLYRVTAKSVQDGTAFTLLDRVLTRIDAGEGEAA